MEILKYILLGIIQGVTEIFPVSSSGHLVIFQELFNISQPGLVFEMFTNTASFLALLILFGKDIWTIIKGFFLYIFKKDAREEHKETFFYALKLGIAVIPIGIVGLIFKDQMAAIKNLLTVGIALIVTGGLLLTIYLTRNLKEEHDEITWKDALIISGTQAFAIFPGISRSGSTIIGGRASRVSLKSILRFSFLAYILISVPTSILSIFELSNATEAINSGGYILAFIFTFAATFLTAFFVMKKLKIEHLIYFSVYCLVVGVLAFTAFFVMA